MIKKLDGTDSETKQPAPPPNPPKEFFWVCVFRIGKVSWGDFGEDTQNAKLYPAACKLLRENRVFEISSAKALVSRKHLDIFCSRFSSHRRGFDLEGGYDKFEGFFEADGGVDYTWKPFFEDSTVRGEQGEQFEPCSSRFYSQPKDDSWYWREDRGRGSATSDELQDVLFNLYEGAEMDYRNVLYYDFVWPPDSVLDGIEPDSEAWKNEIELYNDDAEGWCLFGEWMEL